MPQCVVGLFSPSKGQQRIVATFLSSRNAHNALWAHQHTNKTQTTYEQHFNNTLTTHQHTNNTPKTHKQHINIPTTLLRHLLSTVWIGPLSQKKKKVFFCNYFFLVFFVRESFFEFLGSLFFGVILNFLSVLQFSFCIKRIIATFFDILSIDSSHPISWSSDPLKLFCHPIQYSERESICIFICCLLYTSPSPRDRTRSRMPSSA